LNASSSKFESNAKSLLINANDDTRTACNLLELFENAKSMNSRCAVNSVGEASAKPDDDQQLLPTVVHDYFAISSDRSSSFENESRNGDGANWG
jgi:hypothetical protein